MYEAHRLWYRKACKYYGCWTAFVTAAVWETSKKAHYILNQEDEGRLCIWCPSRSMPRRLAYPAGNPATTSQCCAKQAVVLADLKTGRNCQSRPRALLPHPLSALGPVAPGAARRRCSHPQAAAYPGMDLGHPEMSAHPSAQGWQELGNGAGLGTARRCFLLPASCLLQKSHGEGKGERVSFHLTSDMLMSPFIVRAGHRNRSCKGA